MKKKKSIEIRLIIQEGSEFYFPIKIPQKELKAEISFMGVPIKIKVIGKTIFINLLEWYDKKVHR